MCSGAALQQTCRTSLLRRAFFVASLGTVVSLATHRSNEAPIAKSALLTLSDTTLADVEGQLQVKLQEVRLRTDFVKEQQTSADQARQVATVARVVAEKLRKEAEVASKIAAEKLKVAASAERELAEKEQRWRDVDEEKNESLTFLNRTMTEEQNLEVQINVLRAQRPKALVNAVVADHPTAVGAAAAQLTSRAGPPPNALVVTSIQPSINLTFLEKAGISSSAVFDALKRLTVENTKLMREKDDLSRRLEERDAAREKAKLRENLRNRLVQKDRSHVKAIPPKIGKGTSITSR